MRKRLRSQVFRDATPSRRRIDGLQTCGQRLSRSISAQRQHLSSLQQGFDGSAQPRPELNLAGERTLEHFTCQASVENQGIGKLDWLTHPVMVAQCYQKSTDDYGSAQP